MTAAAMGHVMMSVGRRPGDGLWIAECSCGQQFRGGLQHKAENRCTAHVGEANRASCPNPHKNFYPSRRDAERAIPDVWRMLGGGPALYTYRCRCNRWHLTKAAPQ